ncbi:MAG TPA: class I tRNA ligase family protein, partial [Clostridia bacterium]|nr:class I tRNA ligase family protein [Clostridia bacterium]
GAEHACMHLLYARFATKALRDMGYINFGEPFLSLVHQGTILGTDGNKMSKSKGNVVSPDEKIQKYGADIFRVYLMFCFSYIEGGPWNDSGLESVQRFFDRIERLVRKTYEMQFVDAPFGDAEKELNYVRNATIKSVNNDIDIFSFNTAIARIMELVNAIYAYDNNAETKNKLFVDTVLDLVKLMAPFAPHFAEELNEMMGGKYSIFDEAYPVCDDSALVRDEIEYAIQINSKMRGKIMIASSATNDEIEKIALDAVSNNLNGQAVKKIIVIPKRLINIII